MRSIAGLVRKRKSAYSRNGISGKPIFSRWSTRKTAMLLHQIRQLLAGQQKLERAALAWCPSMNPSFSRLRTI